MTCISKKPQVLFFQQSVKEFFPIKMNWSFSFRPKLVDTLKNYSAGTFFPDLTTGLTVGIVALTLAMAFAIASGVKPEAGIFTAVIAGFLISALDGTKVSIGGPTGALERPTKSCKRLRRQVCALSRDVPVTTLANDNGKPNS